MSRQFREKREAGARPLREALTVGGAEQRTGGSAAGDSIELVGCQRIWSPVL